MPIYEYKCTSCGKKLEKIQKFSDPPLQECPDCKGSLEKLVSHSSFHLKGTGWYVTDYAKRSGFSSDKPGPSHEKPAEKESTAGNKSTAEGKSSEKATVPSQ